MMGELRDIPQNSYQCTSKVKGDAVGLSRRCISIATGAITLLLTTLLTSSAQADDMFLASGVIEELGVMAFLWIAVTPFAEAVVLNAFFKQGFWRALGYSLLANLASMLLSLLWAGMFQEPGWKLALMAHQWGVIPRLLLRSYVITTAEEGMVVALLVRNKISTKTVFIAVAVANLVSYAMITFIFLSMFHI